MFVRLWMTIGRKKQDGTVLYNYMLEPSSLHLCEALDGDDARRQAVDVLRRRCAGRDLICLSDTLPVLFASALLVHVAAAAAAADAVCMANDALKGGSDLLADVGRAGPAVLLWLGDVDDDEVLRAIREAKEAKRVCNLYRTICPAQARTRVSVRLQRRQKRQGRLCYDRASEGRDSRSSRG